MKTTLWLLCSLLLTGCVTRNPKVWYQAGKTEAQIRQDWAESQLAAKRAELGIKPPIVATDDFAVGFGASFANRDAHSAAKAIAPLTMQARGYQLVPLATVPTNAAYLKP